MNTMRKENEDIKKYQIKCLKIKIYSTWHKYFTGWDYQLIKHRRKKKNQGIVNIAIQIALTKV